MNGIEKITARIRADAEAECAAIRAESEERCAAIRAENERAAQEEYWRLVREGVKDTEQRVQRLGRTARLEAKKSVLNMKQEAVSRAFELARQKLAGLPEQDYVAFLAREAAEAAITALQSLSTVKGVSVYPPGLTVMQSSETQSAWAPKSRISCIPYS